jgi:SAM-dependent methyltransferase
MPNPSPELPFTGERFTPECVREIWLEHWHRYVFAARLAGGRRVLDAACGEGYGSALLAQTAADVVGLDISAETISHARSRYGERPRLRFDQADVASLQSLPAASFDLIVSFETLEHLAAQEALLDGFARLLAPGGVLLVSTPDRRTYSDLPGFQNEHHVRELYRDQFEALLTPRFAQVQLYGQKLLFQGVLWRVDKTSAAAASSAEPASAGANTLDAAGISAAGLAYEPLYYLAACAQRPDDLPSDQLPELHLFGDAAESVYRHYEDEIRKGIAAGQRLIALEQALTEERAARALLERQLAELQGGS